MCECEIEAGKEYCVYCCLLNDNCGLRSPFNTKRYCRHAKEEETKARTENKRTCSTSMTFREKKRIPPPLIITHTRSLLLVLSIFRGCLPPFLSPFLSLSLSQSPLCRRAVRYDKHLRWHNFSWLRHGDSKNADGVLTHT